MFKTLAIDPHCTHTMDMAYTDPNFPTKKALKEAIANGDEVFVFSPGPFGVKSDGQVSVEGPHYPAAHSWYAQVEVAGGKVIKVIS